LASPVSPRNRGAGEAPSAHGAVLDFSEAVQQSSPLASDRRRVSHTHPGLACEGAMPVWLGVILLVGGIALSVVLAVLVTRWALHM
jgi:hypothetical protein